METKYTYSIRRQFERRGYSAGFEFSIIESEHEAAAVIFEDRDIFPFFKECIVSSFELFHEFYSRDNTKKLKFIIYDYRGLPIDTTPELVSYLTVRTLCDLFKYDFNQILDEALKEKFYFLNELSFKNTENNLYSLC